MPIALQLSHDAVPEVRARAGRALASLLPTAEGEFATVAEERLVELLDEDGLFIPIAITRGLVGSKDLPGVVIERLTRLAEMHPAYSVRRIAVEVLTSSGP